MMKRKSSPGDDIVSFITLLGYAGVALFYGISTVPHGGIGVWAFMLAGVLLLAVRFEIANKRRRMFPWCVWLGRVCTGSLAAILILVIAHLVQLLPSGFGFALRSLDIDGLIDSRLWSDHMLLAAMGTLSLSGTLLVLIYKGTRKRALRVLLVCVLLCMILMPLSQRFPAGPARAVPAIAALLSWPLYSGISGALFLWKYGKKEQEAYDAKTAAKHAGMPTVSTGTGTRSSAAPRPGAPVNAAPSAAPSSPPRKPASPAAPPRPAAPDLEAALSAALNAYQAQKAQENDRSVDSLLADAAQQLYPGGGSLSHLGGQRQLFMWLTELPGLRGLRSSKQAAALMRSGLPDEPEQFLPLLYALVRAIEVCLEERQPQDCSEYAAMDAETLTGVWFALRMYARVSERADLFEAAARTVEEHFSSHVERMQWLKERAEEGGA